MLNRHRNFIAPDGTENSRQGLPTINRKKDLQDARRDIFNMFKPITQYPFSEPTEGQNFSKVRDSLDREKKTAYITGSSHYKYNRLKDGDWGSKGPMR